MSTATMWWWLGELVNYSHVLFGGGVMLGGFFWLRPIWLQLLVITSVPIAQWLCGGNCPFTALANWLQSRHSPSLVASFIEVYGRVGTLVLIIGLLVLGVYLAFLASRITRGPLIWPGAIDASFKKDLVDLRVKAIKLIRKTGMPV